MSTARRPHLTVFRLRQVWPAYAGRLELRWRALSLEYINRQATPKPLLEVELDLIRRIEPALPLRRWARPDWQWPVTFWPAFEALACAQAQGHVAAYAMSWALRHAFFAEGRSPALRHELLEIARSAAAETPLDLGRFEADWDAGRHKAEVIADSRRGWHELKVEGSPTFVLPDGSQVSSPGMAPPTSTRNGRSCAPTPHSPATRWRRSAPCSTAPPARSEARTRSSVSGIGRSPNPMFHPAGSSVVRSKWGAGSAAG